MGHLVRRVVLFADYCLGGEARVFTMTTMAALPCLLLAIDGILKTYKKQQVRAVSTSGGTDGGSIELLFNLRNHHVE